MLNKLRDYAEILQIYSTHICNGSVNILSLDDKQETLFRVIDDGIRALSVLPNAEGFFGGLANDKDRVLSLNRFATSAQETERISSLWFTIVSFANRKNCSPLGTRRRSVR